MLGALGYTIVRVGFEVVGDAVIIASLQEGGAPTQSKMRDCCNERSTRHREARKAVGAELQLSTGCGVERFERSPECLGHCLLLVLLSHTIFPADSVRCVEHRRPAPVKKHSHESAEEWGSALKTFTTCWGWSLGLQRQFLDTLIDFSSKDTGR
jgi:hypothetical protein